MYKFVILSALVAVCAGSALPQDTPEVAHAKAAHLAAVEQAKARNYAGAWAAPVPVWNAGPAVWAAPAAPAWNSWNGAHAPVVVAHGQVQDTPEVNAEKAKHFALVAEAASRAAGGHSGDHSGAYTGAYDDGSYTGAYDDGAYRSYDDGAYRHDPSGDYSPPAAVWGASAPAYYAAPWAAAPVVVAHGQVQDTPEVAAAKAQHFAAHRAAGGHAW